MASSTVRACVRCHSKKIKCDGAPECQNCADAGVQCEPYLRLRRVEAYKKIKRRLDWLEDEITKVFNFNCRSIKTDTPLEPLLSTPRVGDTLSSHTASASSQMSQQVQELRMPTTENPAAGQQEAVQGCRNNADAPEISLLALNATGELRYLGPSSGSFFANYAASLARTSGPSATTQKRSSHLSHDKGSNERGVVLGDVHHVLSAETVQSLTRSFKLWTQPLYPLLDGAYLESLVARCSDHQKSPRAGAIEQNCDMIVFYLVMALGAINLTNTIKEMQESSDLDFVRSPSPVRPSASYLYGKALDLFERNVQHLHPSVSLIQIESMAIGRFGDPSKAYSILLVGQTRQADSTQMAIEIGLHCSHRNWQISDQETSRRSRVFWTAYLIEISLAYNLGRPPSITDDHVTVNFPECTDETSFALHHIRHKQIQSKIISSVYCSNSSKMISSEDKSRLIQDLQAELDDWKLALDALCQRDVKSSYPFSYWQRLYHGTSFVLHRSSPLCPQPSPESGAQCIRSAGTYIDNLLSVLRNSNVPLSWMLVQGVLFAGLTMLVTVRTNASRLVRHIGGASLLADLAIWTRKCSICLTIINERWSEDLISKLDAQFEELANDTLKTISTSLTTKDDSSGATHMSHSRLNDDRGAAMVPEISPNPVEPPSGSVWLDNSDTTYLDSTMPTDWEYMEPFREFLGWENTQNFWDMFPAQSDHYSLEALGYEQNQRHDSYMPGHSEPQNWTSMFSGS